MSYNVQCTIVYVQETHLHLYTYTYYKYSIIMKYIYVYRILCIFQNFIGRYKCKCILIIYNI